MRLLLSLCLLAFCTPSFAWGDLGHRLVAELAERQLSETARAQIADLLRDEADPRLAAIATWADEIREQPERRGTAPLHYVNIGDATCHYMPERDCADGKCVVGGIGRYTRELADTSLPRAQRVEALKFLVHFLGDVHQPLHTNHHDDRGGNDFQVNLAGKGSNLHSVWDHKILASARLGFDAYADRLDAQRMEIATPAAGDAAAWAVESCSLIDADAIYPTKPGTLDPAYLARMRPRAETQLIIASQRLAGVLERTLGADSVQ